MSGAQNGSPDGEPSFRRGDLPPGGRDRAEEGFESGRTRRDDRREDRRFQSLLKDRATDRSKIADLERRLAETEAQRAKGRLSDLDADLADTEAEARDAFADGDAAKAAKANRRLAELAADRKAAELEEAHAVREAASASKPRPAAESQEWLARNAGWFNKDPQKTKLALLAHEEAVAVEGFAPNTDEYFAHIENRVEAKFPGTVAGRDDDDPEDLVEVEDDNRDRRSVSIRGAAPVSNRAPAPSGRTRTVTATPLEVEAARISGVSIQEYKARQASMKRSGRLESRR